MKDFNWNEFLEADLSSVQIAIIRLKLEDLGFLVDSENGENYCPHCGEDYDKSFWARTKELFQEIAIQCGF